MERKSVGAYIRVSTERQVEGYSIEGQITQIEQFCNFSGYNLIDVYADRGISGKSMNRPELQRMLQDAKNGKLNCVIVYKINRLARNTSDLLSIVEELHRQNVEFFSLSERMEIRNSTDKLLLNILASFFRI